MARARTSDAARGVTLIELTIALGLVGLIVLAVTHLLRDMEDGRAALAARGEAQAENELMFQRVGRLFQTRMQNRPDKGFKIETCSDPAPSASCLDVFRRKRVAGKDVVERFRIKSSCVRLTPEEKASLRTLGANESEVAGSVAELCGFRCTAGTKPIVVLRHWADASKGGTRDIVFPRGKRVGASSAVGAGFCASEKGAEEAFFLMGTAYLKRGGTWKAQLAKKELVAPTKEDASAIEWLP